MKITFFKNENHFCPLRAYCCETAELAKPKYQPKKAPTIIGVAFDLLLFPLIFLYFDPFTSHLFLYFAIVFLVLPLHELCHAVYCWLTGRKVERICFFPYGFRSSSKVPWAYVMTDLSVWSKFEEISISLFPLLILSVIPAILSFFLPSIRMWLLLVSILNAGTSAFDIGNAMRLLSMPAGYLKADHFEIIPNQNFTGVIHRITINTETKELQHRQFQCQGSKMIEMFPPEETDEVKHLLDKVKEKLKEQTNIA